MQTNTIQRGPVVLGTISFENGVSALGTEVVASAAFPAPGGDQTEQFESYEAGLRFLNSCYEAHCEAQGVTPEPKAPEAPEVDEEAAYYAREAAREQEESAHHAAAMEEEGLVLVEQRLVTDAEQSSWVRGPSPAIVDDGSDDDLPF